MKEWYPTDESAVANCLWCIEHYLPDLRPSIKTLSAVIWEIIDAYGSSDIETLGQFVFTYPDLKEKLLR